jgi:hypothetical protein
VDWPRNDRSASLVVYSLRSVALWPDYFYYDPELSWYIGGLALAHGGEPSIIAHPGGPLYLITAMISAAGSFGPLDFSRFRTIGYIAALPINLIGCWLVISTLGMRPLPTRLLAGLLLFLTPQIFEYNTLWNDETFFPAIAGICVAALFLMASERTSMKMAALGSVVLGIAASQKLNFGVVGFAYAISIFVVTAYFKSAATALRLGSITVLCQLLGFVVGTIPLFGDLPYIFQTTVKILVRQGDFGAGAIYPGEGALGLPPLSNIFKAIGSYISGSKAYHILIAFFALSCFAGIWYRARPAQESLIILSVVTIFIFTFSYLL